MLTKNPLNHKLQNYISHHPEVIEQQIATLQHKLRSGEMKIWNKEFNLLPSVVFIDCELHHKYAALAEKYHQLLRKILVLYRERPEVRAYFGFSPLVESLCVLNPGYDNEITICRFDSYPTESGFKILENNTDCPAGVLFTHHHQQAITSMPLISSFISENVKLDATLNQPDEAFFSALLKVHENRTGQKIQNAFCILQLEGRISSEVELMQQVLKRMRIHSLITDPRSLNYKDGKLRYDETVIDVIWNKINTCYFNELLEQPGKISALMKEPHFRHLFTDEENLLIDQLLPWTCQISESKIDYHGVTDSASGHALRNKNKFVLKMPYDIRGEGVIIGKESTDAEWYDAVKEAVKNKSILQEYIATQQISAYSLEHKELSPFNISLDFFMYDGKFTGFGSKLSTSLKVNIFQGGSKNVVLSVI